MGCNKLAIGKDKQLLNSSAQMTESINMYEDGDMAWADRLPACPIFYPSKEEFEDPIAYISRIAPSASKYGICKIKCPLNASITAAEVLMKEKSGFKFTTRVQPMRLAKWDTKDKISFSMSGRQYSYKDYEAMANRFFAKRFTSMASLPPNFIEAEFWREMSSRQSLKVEYGCDIDGSAFSSSSDDPLGRSKWNLQEISTLPRSLFRCLKLPIPGITEPMLYLGMLFSVFAWHIEDHFLYSINYHHSGAMKTWYGVPGHSALEFEKVVREYVYDHTVLERGKNAALTLLEGKTTMFPPKILIENGIPVYRANQNPGEFIITFPQAYHAGFSHGFNCGEAVNFAIADWLPFGASACQRYMSLGKVPVLPHEELLSMEALHLAQSERNSQVQNNCRNSRDSNLDRSLKMAFMQFMKSQEEVRLKLKEQKAQAHVSTEFVDSISCSICRHLCYANVITCLCRAGPICLNHAKEFSKCLCGESCSIVSRRNWKELEDAMYQFEGSTPAIEANEGPFITNGHTIRSLRLEEIMENKDHDYYSSCFGTESTKKTEESADRIELQVLSTKQYSSLNLLSITNNNKQLEACKSSHNVESENTLLNSTVDEENTGTLHSTDNFLGDSTSSVKRKKYGMQLRSALRDDQANLRSDFTRKIQQYQDKSSEASVVTEIQVRRACIPCEKIISRKYPTNICKNGEHKSSVKLEDGIQIIRKKLKSGLCQTDKGYYVILFKDIVQKLYSKKSQPKVLHFLKSKAEKAGVQIEAIEVETANFTGQRHLAFSNKGCLLVKQLLSKEKASSFEKLLKKTFGRLQMTGAKLESSEKEQCGSHQVKRSFLAPETPVDHDHYNPVKRRRLTDIMKLESRESSSLWQEHGHMYDDTWIPDCASDIVSASSDFRRHMRIQVKVPTESMCPSKMNLCCPSNDLDALHSSPRSSLVQSSKMTLDNKQGNLDNVKVIEKPAQCSNLETFHVSCNQFPVFSPTAIQADDLIPGLESSLVSGAGSVGANIVDNNVLNRKQKVVAIEKEKPLGCTVYKARTCMRSNGNSKMYNNPATPIKNKGTIVCEISLAETKMEIELCKSKNRARVSFAEDTTIRNIGDSIDYSSSKGAAEANRNLLRSRNFDMKQSYLQPDSSERIPSTTIADRTADCLTTSSSSLSTIKTSKILNAMFEYKDKYEHHKAVVTTKQGCHFIPDKTTDLRITRAMVGERRNG